jgi:hypothetical protein
MKCCWCVKHKASSHSSRFRRFSRILCAPVARRLLTVLLCVVVFIFIFINSFSSFPFHPILSSTSLLHHDTRDTRRSIHEYSPLQRDHAPCRPSPDRGRTHHLFTQSLSQISRCHHAGVTLVGMAHDGCDTCPPGTLLLLSLSFVQYGAVKWW